jgi:5-methylcytosine-specific restriction protein A
MPMAPRPGCAEPGCPERAAAGTRWCEAHDAIHAKARSRQRNREVWRVSAAKRGYDADWSAARKAKLRRDPLCERCLAAGLAEAAVVVHHIQEVDEHPELRLAMHNLESLCRGHHEAHHGRGPEPLAGEGRVRNPATRQKTG